MANFGNHFDIKDEYITPFKVWKDIAHIIPDRVIWEAFPGTGKSGRFLRDLGFSVVDDSGDFFEENHGEIIVTNPPFSQAPQILERLKQLDKPFIIIIPVSKIMTQYFRRLFKHDAQLKIIIPPNRIQFMTIDKNGKEQMMNRCNFTSIYVCWKIPTLENQITWINDTTQ